MATTTALQLVNRFLRKYRLPTVSDFSSEEALAALDVLNEAREEVLDSRAWKFDEREAVLSTIPYYATAATTVTFTNGSTAAVTGTDNTSAATLSGTHTLRCIPTNSTDRAQTAHACSGVQITLGIFNLALTSAYSGTTGQYTTSTFVAEYQWPAHTNGDSYVKRLLSMYHQEDPLRLVEVDKNFRFDSLVTRLHDTIGDDPDTVYVGRQIRSTDSVSSSPTTTLRDGCIIWPVPTSSAHLDYTYLYRHAPLSAITDTLENVPENVLNCIVELAYGFSLNTMFGNDPAKADRVIAAATTRVSRLHNADRKMVHKKKPLRSLDEKTREHQFGRRIPTDLIS